MHDEYDSLGARLRFKAPALNVGGVSYGADSEFVLAGCLKNASYKTGGLSITTRKCLSDYNSATDSGGSEKKSGGFRTPGMISGTLVYGPDEFVKLDRYAKSGNKPWEVELQFLDSDLVDNGSKVTGKAVLQSTGIELPEDGGRIECPVEIEFTQVETFTRRTVDPS